MADYKKNPKEPYGVKVPKKIAKRVSMLARLLKKRKAKG